MALAATGFPLQARRHSTVCQPYQMENDASNAQGPDSPPFFQSTSRLWACRGHGRSPATCVTLAYSYFSGIPASAGTVDLHSGFLMSNHCGLISQNGQTRNSRQLCNGDYNHGAAIICDSNGNPIGAIDTVGARWTCSPENVSNGCDVGGSGGAFRVMACCDRV
ncbi:hypothetical protein BC835DRAFT_1303148 [Cytidiella melzeri]|nr:hypothetical protein BC835DRAFT_1303148 [Cytidiella melzeri]